MSGTTKLDWSVIVPGSQSLASSFNNVVPNSSVPFQSIGTNSLAITIGNRFGGSNPAQPNLVIEYTVTCTESGIGAAGNVVVTSVTTYTGTLSWSEATSAIFSNGVWLLTFGEEYFSCYEEAVDDCLSC